MASYYLSNDVHLCVIDDDLIWFDGNKYYSTKKHDIGPIVSIIEGWPPSVDLGIATPISQEVDIEELAAGLLDQGLLSHEVCACPPCRVMQATPNRTLEELDALYDRVNLKYWVRFLHAWLLTLIELKLFPLARILRSLAARKAHVGMTPGPSNPSVAELVGAFKSIRRYFYTAHQKCLLDSLVLARFLAAYRVFPALVLGVKTGPFEAHAWIQDSQSVWSCSADYAHQFQPICVI